MRANLKISDRHVNRFQLIKKKFFRYTEIPKPDNWKKLNGNEIWLDLIGQVMVVGGADAADRFHDSPKLKRRVSFYRLKQFKNERDLKNEVNTVLREAGTRYASKSVSKCRKTRAIAHNFKVLAGYKNGAKGLLKRIKEFRGPHATERRVRYLMKIFMYIKSKSARDFLMQKGMVTDAIALDIRIQNILKKTGINIPKGFESRPALYDEIERILLSSLCEPLKMKGVEFDRMLFQNYDNIIKMK
jgi:thermostable 8-oxoguanine DNA glycosylase